MDYRMFFGKPMVRGQRANHHPQRHANAAPAHRAQPVIRAKPPSHSVAPWDITRWVDPIQTTQMTKAAR
ncbi:hypothetical protein I4U23_027695 [Adineta vaga]|nr:hypothetical protein I4U23_027695 [Adineta vaga]